MPSDDDLTRTHADDAGAPAGNWKAMIAAARAGADAVPRAPAPRPPTAPTGDVDPVLIPGYRLVRRISRGGQGTVYEALRDDTQRRVAIKLLKMSEKTAAPERARFEREVHILRSLNNPSIVAFHEHGYTGPRAWFVMDYIEGLPLDEYLASRPRPLRRILELLAEICDAVHAAHQRGVIHRDLKPANVLVDEEGRPYILDFGLARTSVSRGGAGLTKAGEFVGSLLWASPEQLSGDPATIDSRTDVYSLGVMLYHTLTGQFPYALSGVSKATDSIRNVEPIRPSELHAGLGQALETIILRCLQKDPDRRYATAGELAADLRRHLADEPLAENPTDGWRLRPATHRRNASAVLTVARRLAQSVFGSSASASSGDPLAAALDSPHRAAGAALLLLAAAQLLAGILGLALIAAAFSARDPGDWVERGFDLLIVGAYIFFVPAALGLLLLRPVGPADESPSRRRRWFVLATALALVAIATMLVLFRGQQSVTDLAAVSLAIIPGAALLRIISRVLRQHGEWRLAGQATIQFVGLLAFGASALVVLGLRSSVRVVETYPHVLYALTAISLSSGIALGIAATILLAGLHRVLRRSNE